jgi:transcriptional regulator with XRE-family HTH domain
MSLKKRIIEILTEQEHTYAQLAEFIGLSEADLDFALEHNSIDIRTLELISKALRISLYSFFKENGDDSSVSKQKYYFDLWSPNETRLKDEIESLKKQIELFKAQIEEKDRIIAVSLKGK